jgi:hypothetical protein
LQFQWGRKKLYNPKSTYTFFSISIKFLEISRMGLNIFQKIPQNKNNLICAEATHVL